MHKLITQALLSVICLLTLPPASAWLIWQPGQLENDQHILKAAFTAHSHHSSGDPENLANLSATPLQITARPGQTLTVCSHRVTGYSETGDIEPKTSAEDNLPNIVFEDWQTTLNIEFPFPCPDDEAGIQPYHFRNMLRSDEPFMVVIGEDSEKRQKSFNSKSDTLEAPIPGSPFTPSEPVSLLSGAGYGSDSDDDQFHRRPPHFPFMGKADLSLTLLPFIRLPPEWRSYLPGWNWYQWLVGEPDAQAGVTVMIRLNQSDPVFLHLSQWEYRELAGNMLNTHQLLQWLAYKLSGRETFIQTLLDTMALMNEQGELDETLSEKFTEQLMVALEQPDMEFSLEFETRLLAESLSTVSLTSPENGIIHLPDGKPDGETQKLPAEQSSEQSSEKDKASNSQSGLPPDQNQRSHEEGNTPPHHPAGSGQTRDAGEQTLKDYFSIVVGGKEFHIKKEQLSPLNRGQEKAAGIKVYDPANPSESLRLNEVEAAADEGTTLQEQELIREARIKTLQEIARTNAELPEDNKLPVPSFPNSGNLKLSENDSNRVLNYLLTYGTSETQNALRYYYQVNRISTRDGHLLAEVDYRGYPVDETCQICQGLLLSQHSLTACTQAGQHIFHTGCLSHALQAKQLDVLARPRQAGCPVCRADQPPILASKESLVSELHRVAEIGDGAILTALLESDVDIEARDDQGNTALHRAAQAGHSGIVLLLTYFGANFKAVNRAGQLPITIAAEHPDIIEILNQVDQNPGIFYSVLTGREEALRQWLDEGNSLEETRPLDGASLLHLAAQNNHMDIVRHLLDFAQRDYVNQQASNGLSALMLACQNDHTEVTETLLQHHADVNLQDRNGESALMKASLKGHLAVAATLLQHHADVNLQDRNGESALMKASLKGHLAVAATLLQHHADVNLQDRNDESALMKASLKGCLTIATILLQHHADVNLQDRNGESALMKASLKGHLAVAAILLQHHADVNLQDRCGESALMKASLKGCSVVAEILVRYDADVNQQTSDGWRALMLASQEGHEEVVKILLQHRADVNQQTSDGWRALMLASQEGHEKVVKILLQHHADINQQTSDGRTALIQACQNGHAEVVRILLQHADVNLQDSNGESALMLASGEGYAEVVRTLLQHHADVNQQTSDGWIALMLASQEGHEKVVKILLQHHADVNQQTSDGRTALIQACQNGHAEVVRILLQHADVNLQDSDGESALMLATQYGHSEVAILLREHGAILPTTQ